MDASAWSRPAATVTAQWVSPRHSRMQLTACQPDSSGSLRAGAAPGGRRRGPDPSPAAGRPPARGGSPARSAVRRSTARRRAGPRRLPHPGRRGTARTDRAPPTRSNTARMPCGLIEPNAPITASGPGPGQRSAARSDVAERLGERLRQPELDVPAGGAGVPEDPADRGLHRSGVASSDRNQSVTVPS